MTRINRKYTVKIGDKSTVVLAEIKSQAVEKGAEKLFGRRCFWFPDSGLDGYGQVFEALKPTRNNSQPGNSSKTNKTSLSVMPVGKPAAGWLRQRREDAAELAEANRIAEIEQDMHDLAYDAGFFGADFPAELADYFLYSYQRGCINRQYIREEEAERDAREELRQKQDDDRYFSEQQAEAAAENTARIHHGEIIASEVSRIRAIPVNCPITDIMLSQIVKNTIAIAYYETHARGRMGLGEFKREMIAGNYPKLILEYLMSEKIYHRLENKI